MPAMISADALDHLLGQARGDPGAEALFLRHLLAARVIAGDRRRRDPRFHTGHLEPIIVGLGPRR